MTGVHVYLITEWHSRESPDEVPFKIGISSNPESRVHDLNAGNARVLYVHFQSPAFSRAEAAEMEREAHEELSTWALGREWFHCPLVNGMDALRSVSAHP